jgi:hypothetical protein
MPAANAGRAEWAAYGQAMSALADNATEALAAQHAQSVVMARERRLTAACRILVTLRFSCTWMVIGADAPTEWVKQHETSGAGQSTTSRRHVVHFGH